MTDEIVPLSFEQLANMIETTVNRAREIRGHYDLKPYKGSAVYRLLNARLGDEAYRESAQTIYAMTMIPLSGIENILEGIGNLLATYNPFAVSVLSRGVIEWSARLAWMFDRDLKTNDLLARWWSEYLYSIWEHRNVFAEDEGERERLNNRIEQQVNQARSFGFQPIETDRKRLPDLFHIGEPRKRAAAQIDMLYGPLGEGMGKMVWKFYSGFAHGTPYALADLYSRAPVSEDQTPVGIPSENPKYVQVPIALALLGFLEAHAKVIRCHSWEFSYWAEWAKSCEPRLLKLLDP